VVNAKIERLLSFSQLDVNDCSASLMGTKDSRKRLL